MDYLDRCKWLLAEYNESGLTKKMANSRKRLNLAQENQENEDMGMAQENQENEDIGTESGTGER